MIKSDSSSSKRCSGRLTPHSVSSCGWQSDTSRRCSKAASGDRADAGGSAEAEDDEEEEGEEEEEGDEEDKDEEKEEGTTIRGA